MIYIGMDVHKDSLTLALLSASALRPTRLERLPNDLVKLKRWLDRLVRDGELRTCYTRLAAGGKPKKAALTATAHKLLMILNTMVRTGTPWAPCALSPA